jgi:WD40 repeat protein/serine/threonine protein kinase
MSTIPAPEDAKRQPGVTEVAKGPIEQEAGGGSAQTIAASQRPEADAGVAQTVAAPQEKDAEQIREEEKDVPAEWEEGQTILNLYEVKKVHTGGGMGLVYKVHHKNWNTDLAAKSPRANYFKTEVQKENFIRECETWINLGLHPNVVSCYYVRNLGGIPRVFAEYVEGGSLKDWIDNKMLYEGGKDKALERILDIAIQFACGLHYAHEHEEKLVHQDVKPANVMMTSEGTAKVTDFGLAKARALAGEPGAGGPQRSILVSSGGMTPAYCSPEQAEGKPLTRRTDIWSWAVSLLEMFNGEVTWRAGQIAFEVLKSYLETGAEDESIPEMPKTLVELLKQCFQQETGDRPKDMQEIAGKLKEIYEQAVGQEYPRQEPKPAELLADGLNNRAVSMLDLGKKEEAERLYDEALKVDPHHPEATYNRGLLLWRSGRITDDVLVRQLLQVQSSRPREARVTCALGMLHIERGDIETAIHVLKEAQQLAPHDPTIDEAIRSATELGCRAKLASRLFKGHSGPIAALKFFADGRSLLSGSWDHTIRRWGVATGESISLFKGHSGEVTSITISADGKFIVTAAKDGSLRVWDAHSAICLRSLQGHDGQVDSVAAHPSDSICISGGSDKTVRIWNFATGECIRVLREHPKAVSGVAFGKDGTVAVSGGWDGTMRVWDWRSGECLRILDARGMAITALAVSSGCNLALVGHLDGSLGLWNLEKGSLLRSLVGHNKIVQSVSLSDNCTFATSTAMDNTVRLWDVTDGRCLRTIESQGSTAAVLAPDDSMFAWEEQSKKDLMRWEVHLSRVIPLAQQQLLISRPRGSTIVYKDAHLARNLELQAESELASGNARQAYEAANAIMSIDGHAKDVKALDIRAKAGLMGRRIGIRDGWLVRTFEGHKAPVSSVTFTPDARAIVSGGWDGTVRAWYTQKEKGPRVFREHVGPVSSVAISMGGLVVVSGGWDGTIRFRSPALGQNLGTLVSPHEPVCSLAVSSDHHCAITGGGSLAIAHALQANKQNFDVLKQICQSLKSHVGSMVLTKSVGDEQSHKEYNVRVWDLMTTGKCVHVLKGHTGPVWSVSLSKDSRFAVSASEDGTARTWDVAFGKCIFVMGEQKGSSRYHAVALSPDGMYAWVAKDWGLVTKFDLTRGRQICDLKPPTQKDGLLIKGTEHAGSLAVSSDGQFVAVGYEDGTIRIWDTDQNKCVVTLRGHVGLVSRIEFSWDSRWLASGGEDGTVRLWELLSEFHFPAIADWDEGARLYLEIFLTMHCPSGLDGISRVGKPAWNDKNFKKLLTDLQYRGYGWLRPEGVRKKLEEMTANWQGPPPRLGGSSTEREQASISTNDKPRWHETTRIESKKPVSKDITKKPLKTPPNRLERLSEQVMPTIAKDGKIPSRNDPCPCGSGKKYKWCCGKQNNERKVGSQFASKVTCSCGFANPVGNKFCNNCGKPLSVIRSQCPNCNRILPSEAEFCIHCGKSIC